LAEAAIVLRLSFGAIMTPKWASGRNIYYPKKLAGKSLNIYTT
jgi:hypothetical protein